MKSIGNKHKVERASALIIDLLVVGAVFYFIDNFISLRYPISTGEIEGLEYQFGYSLYFIVFFFYFVFFDVFFHGKSIGKKTMKIKVLGTTSLMTTEKNILRSFLKMISFIFFPIAIILFVFFDWTLQDFFLKTITTEEEKIREI